MKKKKDKVLWQLKKEMVSVNEGIFLPKDAIIIQSRRVSIKGMREWFWIYYLTK